MIQNQLLAASAMPSFGGKSKSPGNGPPGLFSLPQS